MLEISPILPPPGEVQTLLDGVSGLTALPARAEALSAAFLGVPYAADPLIGSSTTPERVVVRFDAFDCVTYVETVLALAWSDSPDTFLQTLRRLRYRDGRATWLDRNHYMTTWLDRNSAEGWFTPVLQRAWVGADEERRLSVLKDYPGPTWHPHYLPLSAPLADEARAGDLVCFVSARPDLDVHHVGLLIPGPPLWLRHAGRAKGAVVQQPLSEYLADHPALGMLVARPVPRPAQEST